MGILGAVVLQYFNFFLKAHTKTCPKEGAMILPCWVKTGPREESVRRKMAQVVFGPALNAKEEGERKKIRSTVEGQTNL